MGLTGRFYQIFPASHKLKSCTGTQCMGILLPHWDRKQTGSRFPLTDPWGKHREKEKHDSQPWDLQGPQKTIRENLKLLPAGTPLLGREQSLLWHRKKRLLLLPVLSFCFLNPLGSKAKTSAARNVVYLRERSSVHWGVRPLPLSTDLHLPLLWGQLSSCPQGPLTRVRVWH